MNKAEMENHLCQYQALMKEARKSEKAGRYRQAVEKALLCWPHIDGMMQYERKYNDKKFTNIQAIDLILKYAPLLFDFEHLDNLESLLKEQRRIEKNTNDNLGEKLATARAFMWEAHRLWDYLEKNVDSPQDELRRTLGGDQTQWRMMAESWKEMGLIHREPEGASYRLRLLTRMGEMISAKCPACGSIAEAPKAMFLEEIACMDCQKKVFFTLLSKPSVTEIKE